MPKGVYIRTEETLEKIRKSAVKHGHTINGKNTKTYNIWHDIRQRCYNPNNKRYKDYGGRGIKACVRWNRFKNFLADMGECPDSLVMDRINNNGNYEPSNCRWTDIKTSNRNKRVIKLSIKKANKIRELYLKGYLQREIAKQFNIGQNTISLIVNNKQWN